MLYVLLIKVNKENTGMIVSIATSNLHAVLHIAEEQGHPFCNKKATGLSFVAGSNFS